MPLPLLTCHRLSFLTGSTRLSLRDIPMFSPNPHFSPSTGFQSVICGLTSTKVLRASVLGSLQWTRGMFYYVMDCIVYICLILWMCVWVVSTPYCSESLCVLQSLLQVALIHSARCLSRRINAFDCSLVRRMSKNNTKACASCWTKLPQQCQIHWKVGVIFRRCAIEVRLTWELRSAAETEWLGEQQTTQ